MAIDLIGKCRVCLGDDEQMHYLFNEFDKGISLADILTSTTNFEVNRDDGLSSFVCQSCTTIIVDFYNLKTIYEENESQIKTMLSNGKVGLMENFGIKTGDKCNDVASKSNVSHNQKDEAQLKTEPEDASYIMIKVETNNSDNEDEDSSDDFEESNRLNPYSDLESSHIDDTQNVLRANNENELEHVECEYQEINTYTCPECSDCFLYKHDIHAHMVSKHDITEIDYDEISELSLLKVKINDNEVPCTNQCKICSKPFSTTDAYKEHIETHKKNVCDICGVGFIKKSYLKDHQEIHCTEKRHVCNYCNKAFKRRTVLVKHRRIHTHPRQCICEMCGKAFNDKGTLKTHIMLLHVRERNYMCLICGVKFPLKATLEKHIRRHQNKEREFFCTQCPLGYRDKSSLDRHIYVKHSGQNIKSTCNDCGKQYTTVSNLFKHQRTCHSAQTCENNQ